MTEAPVIGLLTGEASGDLLGAKLVDAIRARGLSPRFLGVAGEGMRARGVESFFPADEIAFFGIASVVANLAPIWRRVRMAEEGLVEARPDVLVLIDSPGFTHTVGRRVARRLPGLPIVNYVSPSIWAWRPGRAARMRAYVDHVLTLLPFEPEALARLGGPPATYVGHPLVEKRTQLTPAANERAPLGPEPVVAVLPGSRRSELKRLMPVFGATLPLIRAARPGARFVLPTLPSIETEVRARAAAWGLRPEIVVGEAAREALFRRAHAALAASGTVTLELALARVPTIVAYRVEPLVRPFKGLMTAPSIVLANLVIGENVVPEFLDSAASPARLAGALLAILEDGPQRRRQEEGFAHLAGRMALPEGRRPSELAAEVVIEVMRRGPRRGAAEPPSAVSV